MQLINWIIFVFPVISSVHSGMYLFFFFKLIFFIHFDKWLFRKHGLYLSRTSYIIIFQTYTSINIVTLIIIHITSPIKHCKIATFFCIFSSVNIFNNILIFTGGISLIFILYFMIRQARTVVLLDNSELIIVIFFWFVGVYDLFLRINTPVEVYMYRHFFRTIHKILKHCLCKLNTRIFISKYRLYYEMWNPQCWWKLHNESTLPRTRKGTMLC